MNKINIDEESLSILKEIFKKCCPESQVLAYGSRIKNDSHSGSDLDLVIKNFKPVDYDIAQIKEQIRESNIPFLVDINEFEKLPLSFQEEIEKENAVIFGGNS